MDPTTFKAKPVCSTNSGESDAKTSSSSTHEANDYDDGMVVVGGSMWTREDYIALCVPDDFYDTGEHKHDID